MYQHCQPTLEPGITVENDKLYISSYDELADYEEVINAGYTPIGEFNYYRVYYELVEKDGKFEANKIRVDKQDICCTAAT